MKTMSSKLLSITALCLLMSFPASHLYADVVPRFHELQLWKKPNQGPSKSRAAAAAQKKYGGKVLNVKEVKDKGQTYYRVKLLLDSGRVKVVTINGES